MNSPKAGEDFITCYFYSIIDNGFHSGTFNLKRDVGVCLQEIGKKYIGEIDQEIGGNTLILECPSHAVDFVKDYFTNAYNHKEKTLKFKEKILTPEILIGYRAYGRVKDFSPEKKSFLKRWSHGHTKKEFFSFVAALFNTVKLMADIVPAAEMHRLMIQIQFEFFTMNDLEPCEEMTQDSYRVPLLRRV